MTDIEGFLAIYGHCDNLLNNNVRYFLRPTSAREKSKKVMGVVNHITYGRGGVRVYAFNKQVFTRTFWWQQFIEIYQILIKAWHDVPIGTLRGLQSVDEILWCDHSNETSSVVLSHDTMKFGIRL